MTLINPVPEERRITEKLPAGELPPDDRGQDPVREALEESFSTGEARPLTRAEREAAERDKGISEPVYAPASERVPKAPAPGDEKLVIRKPESEASEPPTHP